MKLKIFIATFVVVLVLAPTGAYLGNIAFAQEPKRDATLYNLDVTGPGAGYTKTVTVMSIAQAGLGGALAMISIAILLLLIYGGTRWMIARGNAEDVTKAKDIIEQALIGLVIILGAWGLASFVFGRLQGKVSNTATDIEGGAQDAIIGLCVCPDNSCENLYQFNLTPTAPGELDAPGFCQAYCNGDSDYKIISPATGQADCSEFISKLPPTPTPDFQLGACVCQNGSCLATAEDDCSSSCTDSSSAVNDWQAGLCQNVCISGVYEAGCDRCPNGVCPPPSDIPPLPLPDLYDVCYCGLGDGDLKNDTCHSEVVVNEINYTAIWCDNLCGDFSDNFAPNQAHGCP